MDARDFAVFTVALIVTVFVGIIFYPYSSEPSQKTIQFNEPEMRSGPNGELLGYCYDNGMEYVNYSFMGETYATRYNESEFRNRLKLEKDSGMIARYFNNSSVVSFSFYVDKKEGGAGDESLVLIKLVGNQDKAFWAEEKIPNGDYGRRYYSSSCELLPENNTHPKQAIITYEPFILQYIVVYMFLFLVVWILVWCLVGFVEGRILN